MCRAGWCWSRVWDPLASQPPTVLASPSVDQVSGARLPHLGHGRAWAHSVMLLHLLLA